MICLHASGLDIRGLPKCFGVWRLNGFGSAQSLELKAVTAKNDRRNFCTSMSLDGGTALRDRADKPVAYN